MGNHGGRTHGALARRATRAGAMSRYRAGQLTPAAEAAKARIEAAHARAQSAPAGPARQLGYDEALSHRAAMDEYFAREAFDRGGARSTPPGEREGDDAVRARMAAALRGQMDERDLGQSIVQGPHPFNVQGQVEVQAAREGALARAGETARSPARVVALAHEAAREVAREWAARQAAYRAEHGLPEPGARSGPRQETVTDRLKGTDRTLAQARRAPAVAAAYREANLARSRYGRLAAEAARVGTHEVVNRSLVHTPEVDAARAAAIRAEDAYAAAMRAELATRGKAGQAALKAFEAIGRPKASTPGPLYRASAPHLEGMGYTDAEKRAIEDRLRAADVNPAVAELGRRALALDGQGVRLGDRGDKQGALAAFAEAKALRAAQRDLAARALRGEIAPAPKPSALERAATRARPTAAKAAQRAQETAAKAAAKPAATGPIPSKPRKGESVGDWVRRTSEAYIAAVQSGDPEAKRRGVIESERALIAERRQTIAAAQERLRTMQAAYKVSRTIYTRNDIARTRAHIAQQRELIRSAQKTIAWAVSQAPTAA